MNFRFDYAYGFKVQAAAGILAIDSLLDDRPKSFEYMGITIRESPYAHLATKTVFKIVKSHPRARRKRYTVQKFQEPCILQFTDPLTGRQTLVVHPDLMPSLKEACA